MKTFHKITLGIALAIASTATCLISVQAKGNIKETLLSQNIEAISSGEGWFNNILWQKEWNSCTLAYCTVKTPKGTVQINGSEADVEAYCKITYSSYTIICCREQAGQKSYCKDGKTLCWSNDCR